MLEIKNLHAKVSDKEILKGVNLTIGDGEIHALMGTNGAGKSTLSNVIVGNPAYEVTEGSITFNGIPGVSMTNFMRAAVNARREALGKEPLKSTDFLKVMREKRKLVEIDQKLMNRSVNEGFSGGERKRNEIFQMAMLEPTFCILDETDSGLDVDALRIVAEGFNKLRTDKTSAIVITHYQRLLDYICPDFVHVLIDGRIVKTGTAELAQQIEEQGFDWLKEEQA